MKKLLPISVVIAILLWSLFAYQRVLVLKENDVKVCDVASSIGGFKYLIGLSYSAEEMHEMIMKTIQLREMQLQYEQMQKMRQTL